MRLVANYDGWRTICNPHRSDAPVTAYHLDQYRERSLRQQPLATARGADSSPWLWSVLTLRLAKLNGELVIVDALATPQLN